MIARFTAFLAILYALGFALFAVSLGKPAKADAPASDAIVVLTGGKGRIEQAVAALAAHRGRRLLIAGADPSVSLADLEARVPRAQRRWLACCTDLGTESVDTRSNAEEAKRWLDQRHATSLRLVTSDWHMRRADYEFRRHLGPGYRIVRDAVPTEPGLMLMFGEYNKYLLRRLAVLFHL